MTRKACIASGRQIVGDIGNGAIFRDDYLCPTNGLPPHADIIPVQGQGDQIAIEGEVCCGAGSSSTNGDVTVAGATAADRDEVSEDECTVDRNGVVVGDIGNGKVFLDDYVCESSGQPPVANVVSELSGGNSAAVEGGVCCLASSAAGTTTTASDGGGNGPGTTVSDALEEGSGAADKFPSAKFLVSVVGVATTMVVIA